MAAAVNPRAAAADPAAGEDPAAAVTLAARLRHRVLDVDLTLPLAGGEVTVLFGPSGAGKTTLLRCLAGLERPERGRLAYGDEVWDDATRRRRVPARQRRVGYLFQDHALFPHLDVSANVAYGLRGVPRAERAGRVARALAAAGAAHLAGRPVRQLSGGEAQRVALARALAPRPRLLLLDEPLSALDTPTRTRLRGQLRQALTTAGVPAVVVTHERAEALALGDRMVVLVGGRVRQVGTLGEVFGRPADATVAAAVGTEAVLPGEVVAGDGGSAGAGVGLVQVRVGPHVLASSASGFATGEPVLACVRAEEVAVELPGPPGAGASPRNRLSATVSDLHADGPLLRVVLDAGGVTLAAYVTRVAAEDLSLSPGVAVTAVVKATAVHLIGRG